MTQQNDIPEPESIPSRDPEDQEFSSAPLDEIPPVAGGDDTSEPAQGEGESNSY